MKRNVVSEIRSRAASFAVAILGLAALASPVRATQIDIIGPADSGAFGTAVTVLPNGNIVITDPEAGVSKTGAVYLYGPDGTRISRLTGSSPNDRIGSAGIVVLANGNFVIRSPHWSNREARDAGAATWVDGSKGLSGVVSARNSLVGTTVDDEVAGYGHAGVVALSNGNYVVASPNWNNGVTYDSGDFMGVYGAGGFGAVTWGNGSSGVTGIISPGNSLVGTTKWDHVGEGVTALSNGNYVVASPYWGDGVAGSEFGAVTWANGATGLRGTISSNNSLTGTIAGDRVGSRDLGVSGITALSNGNYVVVSSFWSNGAANGQAGAATWGNGVSGTAGQISSSNSLVGTMAGDRIGADGVTALSNGNYVVASSYWNDGVPYRHFGAITWGNGASGTRGAITRSNSLVGTNTGFRNSLLDFNVAVAPLSNGNYVVASPYWNKGIPEDWADGSNRFFDALGAATWGNGAAGTAGLISSSNSLVGATPGAMIGSGGITALSNGNYVVASPGQNSILHPFGGAATWGNGATGTTGAVSSSNSLMGVGSATALSNGNYVVSGGWSNGVAGIPARTETWVDGASGATDFVSMSNSLFTLSSELDFPNFGGITALSNGNYVVSNSGWNNGIAGGQFGAVTWVNGASATSGTVSASNSLVGTIPGGQFGNGGVVALSDGFYVVTTVDYGTARSRGVTLVDGRIGVIGTHPSSDTVLGGNVHSYDPARRRLAVGRPRDNIVTLLTLSTQSTTRGQRVLPPLLLHSRERAKQ